MGLMSRQWQRRNGGSWRWRTVRAAVLERDGYRCRLRIADVCTTLANEAHHLRSPALGDDPAFLVAACRACNLHVGDPTRHGDPAPAPRTVW
jgi:5-methylcytosine-specific restriction endonuclease McrA